MYHDCCTCRQRWKASKIVATSWPEVISEIELASKRAINPCDDLAHLFVLDIGVPEPADACASHCKIGGDGTIHMMHSSLDLDSAS